MSGFDGVVASHWSRGGGHVISSFTLRGTSVSTFITQGTLSLMHPYYTANGTVAADVCKIRQFNALRYCMSDLHSAKPRCWFVLLPWTAPHTEPGTPQYVLLRALW